MEWRKFRAVFLVLLMVLSIFCFGGCSNKDKIVGTWKATDGSSSQDFTFYKDGTLSEGGTWDISDSKLAISIDDVDMEMDFEIKGSKMTWTNIEVNGTATSKELELEKVKD